jgi:hypothetical protein
VFIVVLSLLVNFVGDGLRDAFDPSPEAGQDQEGQGSFPTTRSSSPERPPTCRRAPIMGTSGPRDRSRRLIRGPAGCPPAGVPRCVGQDMSSECGSGRHDDRPDGHDGEGDLDRPPR